MEKRKDTKNRILKVGESQRKDGRYAYKYVGKDKKAVFVYSWKLVPTDKIPKGKREDISLREKEEKIKKDLLDKIELSKKSLTVSELYKKQNEINSNVKPNTVMARNYLLNRLQCDLIGKKPIDKINVSDAKQWAKRLKEEGISYKSIKNHKRSLCSVFKAAIQDNYIRSNPFDFNLKKVIPCENKFSKDALNSEEQRKLLAFLKDDKVYKKNYDDVVILLFTGMRISEMCGITLSDVNMKDRVININHQLLKGKTSYYISEPKTKSGYRKIYMIDIVYEAFKRKISNIKNKRKYFLDGYTDFIFLNESGNPKTVYDYDALFRRIQKKYNKLHPDEKIFFTPHKLRHTFCTNMAKKGMNPKALQYIMGHSDISMTFNYYTHIDSETVRDEMIKIEKNFTTDYTSL